jgi:DnaK suppressor protein
MATVINRVPDTTFTSFAANDAATGYRPSAEEPFMSLRQQAYFRTKLLRWKDAILLDAAGTLSQLQIDSLREADLTDRASSETDWSIELRTRASWCPRSMRRSAGSTRANMAIAR